MRFGQLGPGTLQRARSTRSRKYLKEVITCATCGNHMTAKKERPRPSFGTFLLLLATTLKEPSGSQSLESDTHSRTLDKRFVNECFFIRWLWYSKNIAKLCHSLSSKSSHAWCVLNTSHLSWSKGMQTRFSPKISESAITMYFASLCVWISLCYSRSLWFAF